MLNISDCVFLVDAQRYSTLSARTPQNKADKVVFGALKAGVLADLLSPPSPSSSKLQPKS